VNWEKLLGALLLLAGAVIWTRWAISLEWIGKLPSQERAGRLFVVLLGRGIAWTLWHRLDRHVNAEQLYRRRNLDMAGAVDPRRSVVPLTTGTRVDLGPCPSCGGGLTAVIPSPAGVVQVRCRECGLIGTPPELQTLVVRPDAHSIGLDLAPGSSTAETSGPEPS
jgi:hypothetical protein